MTDKEIVERILKIEKQQRREEEADRLSGYNKGKVHLKQMQFHKCLKRNRWVFGGNRSGKTECGAVEAVWLARGIHPYRQNKSGVCGWVVSVSYEVQREVAQSKILHYLNPAWIADIIMLSGAKGSPQNGVVDTIVIKNVFGGASRICFKSSDQGREKFQGASLDFVWFDEEPPKDIYEECKMRVLDRRGDIFGTMTPLKGLTWVYEEIYLNKYRSDEVCYITMEWADNPFLDENEVEAMSKSMSESTLASRRFGRFMQNTGLVYDEFDEGLHVIEPFDVPKEWYDKICIDPGLNNPLSAHFYCVDFDGNIYVIAEHYQKGKDIDYHAKAIESIAKRLDWHYNRSGKLEALIDSAANQRTLAGSKSVAELFYEKGIAVNTKVNKEVFGGIAAVKEYLACRPPKFFIFKNCVNMIGEIKSYWWGDGDCPVKKDDHAMDELRYYIMSRPRNSRKEKKDKPIQEVFKESLIKR
ncbi:MAG: terminase family protein [Clostridia bacterium]|nr:terminase family protein [Clostridia bacterium]